MSNPSETYDCTIVGAGFAGLSCATAVAGRGFRVQLLEKKASPCEKLRTTGIIVREAVEDLAALDGLKPWLWRKIPAVRLYAPNLRSVRLEAPGYYFLATDTPGVMRWLTAQALEAGAEIRLGSPFKGAQRDTAGWDLGQYGRCRFLVGADGTHSTVAGALGLGRNSQLLHGIEYEYALRQNGARLAENDALHCFLDRRLAPGYIAWALQGVDHIQVGLARRGSGGSAGLKTAMDALRQKIAAVVNLRDTCPDSVRAGPIPCGGLVSPHADTRVLLVGDAAGMVSPLTAGGIHTALRYGLACGHAIADFLSGRSPDPAKMVVLEYPRFGAKRLLRIAFDHMPGDWLFNVLLSTPLLSRAARKIYFHR